MYTANIPIIDDKARASRLFQAGLKFYASNGVRPHLLYGTNESKNRLNPRILPPLLRSQYDNLNPLKGFCTSKSDIVIIEELFRIIQPLFKEVAKVGYEGSYDEYGKMSGKGVFHFANGDSYDGYWLNSKKNGKGTFRYADGGFYIGEFANNKRAGQGVCEWSTGDSYDGCWLDDKQHGRGIFKWADGSMYNGDWQFNKKHGLGVFRWADGNEYEGEFFCNKMHGKGRYNWSNGSIYEGDYLEGSRHGRGTVRWANGNIFEGFFVDNLMTSGSMYLSDSDLTLSAIFTAGDFAIVMRQRVYHLILKNEDGSIYKEGDFYNGKFASL
jgi:hypothetical protein